MLFLSFTIIVLLIGCSGSTEYQPAKPGPGGNTPDTVSVLLIGSSYLGYNDFPNMFYNFCKSGNKELIIGQAIEYGKLLDYHAENQSTIEKINSRKWDFVILQDAPSTIGYPDDHHLIFPSYTKHETYKAIESLNNTVKSNNAEAKTILIMPWAFEDGLTWIPGQSDTYEIMQRKVYDNSISWARSLNIGLSPVGWAFNEVIKTNKQLHYLFLSDFNHASYRGSYLMACVLYTTIFNKSCINNNYYGYITRTEAEYFQSVASGIWANFEAGL